LLPESRTKAISSCTNGASPNSTPLRADVPGVDLHLIRGEQAMWIVLYVAMAASLTAMADLMRVETDEDQEPFGHI
jgi:hypothetical protein